MNIAMLWQRSDENPSDLHAQLIIQQTTVSIIVDSKSDGRKSWARYCVRSRWMSEITGRYLVYIADKMKHFIEHTVVMIESPTPISKQMDVNNAKSQLTKH